MTKQEEMVFTVTTAINKLFDPESEEQRYSWKDIDLTDFFTAYVKAGGYIYNRITGDDKNYLEFTHVANQLIVQDLMEKKDEVA
jgi:predicted GNAT superfamily acetyltransferase